MEWRARERALIWQIRGDRAIALVETAFRAVKGARAIVLLPIYTPRYKYSMIVSL